MSLVKTIFVAVILAFSSVQISAHSNHESFDPITEQQASAKADKVLQSLLANQKLDATWKEVKVSSVTTQDAPYGKVWVVSYQNSKEKEESKKTLYVFLDEMGNPLTVNHEGKL